MNARKETSPHGRSQVNNATHAGAAELIRARSEAVLTREDDGAMPQSPSDALLLTNQILERTSARSARSATTTGFTRKPGPKKKSAAASFGSNNRREVKTARHIRGEPLWLALKSLEPYPP